jgi:hypothetical protein
MAVAAMLTDPAGSKALPLLACVHLLHRKKQVAGALCWVLQVKVKRRGDDRKFLARVLSIGVDCDVALLTVEDEAFWWVL